MTFSKSSHGVTLISLFTLEHSHFPLLPPDTYAALHLAIIIYSRFLFVTCQQSQDSFCFLGNRLKQLSQSAQVGLNITLLNSLLTEFPCINSLRVYTVLVQNLWAVSSFLRLIVSLNLWLLPSKGPSIFSTYLHSKNFGFSWFLFPAFIIPPKMVCTLRFYIIHTNIRAT